MSTPLRADGLARQVLRGTRVVQLGQIIDGQPSKGLKVPDLRQELYARHELDRADHPNQVPGSTGASDRISMSTHSGTHMDSLSHIGYRGLLVDGTPIDGPGVQDDHLGVRMATRENFSPIVSRGVLLDFAALLGVERVPADYVVRAEQFAECCARQEVQIRAGDTVLFRMGWDTIAHDNAAYVAMPVPGPERDVARLLVERGVVAVGSDTMPFEAAPGDVPLAVHVELIPKAGVHIFEMLDLRELAATGVHEFLFVAAPLRIRGATGSPVNPLAIVEQETR